MMTATITSKGQMTVPKQIRDKLHLRVGSKVHFFLEGPTSARIVAGNRRVAEVFGLLAGKPRKVRVVKDIDKALAVAFARGSIYERS